MRRAVLHGLRRAKGVAGRLLRGAARVSKMQPDWRQPLVAFAYRQFLGRAPNEQESIAWTTALHGTLTPAAFLEQVAYSKEANRMRTATEADGPDQRLQRRQMIEVAYGYFLHRQPTEEEHAVWRAALDKGLCPEGFIDAVAKSGEARQRLHDDVLGDGMADGEFLVRTSRYLFGRGLFPYEVATWQRQLELSPGGRLRFATDRINERLRHVTSPTPPAAQICVILGTNKPLSKATWDERRWGRLPAGCRAATAPSSPPAFAHSGAFKVSMIASLYRGGRFIERFLQNITSQTMFDASELIIIDAGSPDGERETIARYQKSFDNIVYQRIDFRIGIYEAWNLGVALARGTYLTNTNLDDLRRPDSIALQAAYLDNNPGVSVAYQEFFYTLDADLSFDDVAKIGFTSELPIVTRHNLLDCNSPHNAPMWRKSLHDSVGLFEPKYKSGGDHEFWLRCLSAGHRFGKINTPHVVYFQNPEGMSTKPDTPGIQESHETLNIYSPKLISPALLDTRQGFIARLGFDEAPPPADPRPYYDIAQDALLRLARDRVVTEPVVQPENRGGANERRPLQVLLDGLCFQHTQGAGAPILAALSARPGGPDGFDLFVLDRGFCPAIDGLQRIDFPSYHGSYTAADSLLIQERCDALGIDVFMSAGCTTALATPQLQIVPEGWGMEAAWSRPVRVEKEHRLAAAYARRLACLSALAHAQLFLRCPAVDPARVIALYGEQAPATEVSSGQILWLGLCNAWWQTANTSPNEPAAPFYRNWTHLRRLQAEVDVGVD
jgi:hypothetical protein